MTSRTKNIITIIAALQIAILIGVVSLPAIIENVIPGQYWGYIPERLLATTGVRPPQAPGVGEEVASEAVESVLELDLSAPISEPEAEAIVEATPTLIPTATPEPTVEVVAAEAGEATEAEEAIEEVVEPTAVPTEEPTPEPTLVPTKMPLPIAARINGIEAEAQEFNNCGPTNLSILLNFYGDPTTQLEAASYLKPNNQDRNVSPWQISDYVNEETGLRSITRSNGTQEMLREFVAAGYPVVIEKGYDPDTANAQGWYGHYLTIFGYSDEASEYYTIDTFLGPFRQSDVKEGYELEDGMPYSYEYVDLYWEQFNHTFYIVYAPEDEAEINAILGDGLLDDTVMWTGAAQRAQETLESEPENQYAWFNLGTALTRLGEISGDQSYYENGAVAFDKARSIGLPSRMLWYQHRPYIAYMKTGRYDDMLELADATLVDPGGRNVEETYFYKGHALSFTGDLDGSAAAFQQALKLNEFFYPAQFALDYINSIR